MEIPFTAVKNLLAKELDSFRKEGFKVKFTLSDVSKQAMFYGFNYLGDMLIKAETFDDLENYVTHAGYRMSLQEWIDSL